MISLKWDETISKKENIWKIQGSISRTIKIWEIFKCFWEYYERVSHFVCSLSLCSICDSFVPINSIGSFWGGILIIFYYLWNELHRLHNDMILRWMHDTVKKWFNEQGAERWGGNERKSKKKMMVYKKTNKSRN